MLNKKSFLVVDFGAPTSNWPEFELTEAGGLSLKQYGFKSLGQDGTQEATRESAMLKGLQEVLGEKSFDSRNVNICAPGYHTFSNSSSCRRWTPPRSRKSSNMRRSRTCPSRWKRLVWDYQIWARRPRANWKCCWSPSSRTWSKVLFRTAEKAGLRLQLVDVSPAALCNAFRYNYGDLEGCSDVVGHRGQDQQPALLRKGNVYSRGINIGANSITQDFAKESKISYDEAERLKIAEGFVSLGGAYEEPTAPIRRPSPRLPGRCSPACTSRSTRPSSFIAASRADHRRTASFLSGGATSMLTRRSFSPRN